jgi:hypothetical protein
MSYLRQMQAAKPHSEFYAEDGHPTNVGREHGFVHEDGIVVCGECAHDDAREQHNGHWDWNLSARYLDRAGYEPHDPAECDDWCSNCDKGIVAR